MRKPVFIICENKGADQLRGNLWFRYIHSTVPLLPKSEISSLYPSSVAVESVLCQTSSETRLEYHQCLKCLLPKLNK